MAGGIIDLLAQGQNNLYLTGSPQITHFKSVYKTHTNFSMESININFNRTDCNIYETTQLIAKIPRNADLVGQMYLTFELPDIISDETHKFRWAENLAEALINDIYITIGGNKIDQMNGEFMHMMNMLTYTQDKRELFNKMTGNTIEFTNPERFVWSRNFENPGALKYKATSSIRIGNEYPYSYDPSKPSIKSRTLYLPLAFWFNRDLANALPLISLQYAEVQIVITLNPISHIYKIFYYRGGVPNYYAPSLVNPNHGLHNFVSNTYKKYLISYSVLDMKLSLEANYIFLDEKERRFFAYKPVEYLINQVRIIPFRSLKENNSLELVLVNPVKEIMWVCKRNDQALYNNWFDFTDNLNNILVSTKILFNGIERLREKPWEFFNNLQAFQHHRGISKEGLFLYSFAINPDEFQPSGSCNMSKINRIQFVLTLRNPVSAYYEYDCNFYTVNYNILRIANGLGGLVFAL